MRIIVITVTTAISMIIMKHWSFLGSYCVAISHKERCVMTSHKSHVTVHVQSYTRQRNDPVISLPMVL